MPDFKNRLKTRPSPHSDRYLYTNHGSQLVRPDEFPLRAGRMCVPLTSLTVILKSMNSMSISHKAPHTAKESSSRPPTRDPLQRSQKSQKRSGSTAGEHCRDTHFHLCTRKLSKGFCLPLGQGRIATIKCVSRRLTGAIILQFAINPFHLTRTFFPVEV